MADASADAIRETLQRYRTHFSAGDRDAWLSLFAADPWIEDPIGTKHEGLDGLGAFFDGSHAMADSIELRGGITKVCGPEAIVAVEIRPTIGGTAFAFTALEHLTFDDQGRIRSMRAFWSPEDVQPAAE